LVVQADLEKLYQKSDSGKLDFDVGARDYSSADRFQSVLMLQQGSWVDAELTTRT
jgi:hypothetical protein